MAENEPKKIVVRGANVHNLKNINVDVPLHQIGIVVDLYKAADDRGGKGKGG